MSLFHPTHHHHFPTFLFDECLHCEANTCSERFDMDVIIILQGFRGRSGKYLLKEAAVLDVDGIFIAHWILGPTYPYIDLPTCWREANNKLTTKEHGIEWFEGEAEEQDVLHNIRELGKHAEHIFTIGVTEASYLQQLITREVVNLDEEPIWKTNENLQVEEQPLCYLHALKKNLAGHTYKCALQMALKIRKILTKKRSSDEVQPCGNSTPNTNDNDNSKKSPPNSPKIDNNKSIFNIF